MKILLVEDDQIISSTLTNNLLARHFAINLATDGQTGLDLAKKFEYDLVLLDVMLPKLDGLSLCKKLRSQGYQNPILLLTAKDSMTDRVMGLDAGADDYMIKPFNMEELMARIRALLRRGKPVQSSVILWENLRFDAASHEVSCGDQFLHLTPKEYCLLELFLFNPKRIFNRRAILERLWDFADSPGEETVSTHIKCLRQKLKASGVSDPIETVHGLGYRLRPPFQSKKTNITASSTFVRKKDKSYQQKVQATTSRIWEKFQGKLTHELTVLEQMAAALKAGQLTPELQQLAKQTAHKLAGSLGIFGLVKCSQLARELEDLLWQPLATLKSDGTLEISRVLSLLQQELSETSDFPSTAEIGVESPLLLIVADDLLLAEQMRMGAIAWGLRVEVAAELDTAREIIRESPPDVILLDLNPPSFSGNGLTLLRQIVQYCPRIPILVFTEHGSLKDRLKVARFKGCVFLQKPLPIQEILKAVTQALNQAQTIVKNRIMVVDHDIDALANLTSLLAAAGIEVIVLDNPLQFWEVLIASTPDLLLLNLELPNFNGIELCQIVRSDFKWHSLPIILWSTCTEAEQIDQAFAAGADDYINKSTPESELIIQIIRRLKRVGFQQGLDVEDIR